MVLKIAVVGAGLMGRWHSHFAKSCGAQIEAIVDSDEPRARALADRVGCKTACQRLDLLLGIAAVDVVHICTPTQAHAELIRLCIDGGIHVLVEKPLAETAAVTSELLTSAHAKRVLLNPVHQFPFQPGFLELIQRQKTLGNPVRVGFLTCSAGGENKSPGERRAIMVEILPHPLSLLYGLFGSAVKAENFKIARITDEDLELSADIGATAVSVVISLRGRPTRNELSFIADGGSVHLDLFHGYALFEGGEVSRSAKILQPLKYGAGMVLKAGTNLARRAAAAEPAYPGLRELISRFYDAVKSGGAAPISDEEMLLAAAIADRLRT